MQETEVFLEGRHCSHKTIVSLLRLIEAGQLEDVDLRPLGQFYEWSRKCFPTVSENFWKEAVSVEIDSDMERLGMLLVQKLITSSQNCHKLLNRHFLTTPV